MARLNVYVPDELADAARAAGLNVSALTQRALAGALALAATESWLARFDGQAPRVRHDQVTAALDEARDELGG
ncbi:type II toxin-antitoxin system CcdA family antitoxin [Nocardioides ferulae]|uniref:type II toxin-antitoxin system CcdA family antitoxin n=1 Tax=Nocardioides ferulae TaxID=2340821 RepID=UPI000EAF470D|nr:type II toxin-antitoxin system CcdA family antitoxin [Nocardioides ferulae]